MYCINLFLIEFDLFLIKLKDLNGNYKTKKVKIIWKSQLNLSFLIFSTKINLFLISINRFETFQLNPETILLISLRQEIFRIQILIGFSIEIRDDYNIFWNPIPSGFNCLSLLYGVNWQIKGSLWKSFITATKYSFPIHCCDRCYDLPR